MNSTQTSVAKSAVPNRSLESYGTAYLWAVPTLGVAVLLYSLLDVYRSPPGVDWLLLTILTTLVSTFTRRIPGSVVRLSVSETLVFLATLMFGPSAGTITAGLDALVMSLRLRADLRTAHRLLFNVGALALAVWPAAHLFYYLSGIPTSEPRYDRVGGFVGPLYVFAAVVFLLNSSLVALAVAIDKRTSALQVWRRQFQTFAASYLASAAIAAVLVALASTRDYALVALLLPLVVVSILGVRTTLGRLSDEHQHLTEVNHLYLATIETLAMAIDAKDQVTHGHIRRVQRFAVGLANAIGISEAQQIRAIEAAALLHDMGKLAIPEFILNKPGQLTAREFSIMKTHAAVGADLLSSIQFPYPVVPIVRHHHEAWNGSGYPDGLAGADIPIGARILAVVDCYDALTSHRPYRPAMAPADAIEILAQRRGKVYDPMVVDTFIRIHDELRETEAPHQLPSALLASSVESTPMHPIGSDVQDAPADTLKLLACLSPFPQGQPIRLVCRQLVDSLRSVAAFDTAVVYGLNDAGSLLEALYSDGASAQALRALRIPVAERLTGWVAAHRTAVWNSDAGLDLALSSIDSDLCLASSLPLSVDDTLVGVLTLYGRREHQISIAERRTLEILLPMLARSIAEALTRPGVCIDCRHETVRQAALGALESLLSHSPRGTATLALTMSPIPGLRAAAESSEQVSAEIARRLSPSMDSQRCVLLLSCEQLLVCSLDNASPSDLQAEFAVAVSNVSLEPFVVSSALIRTPLELQDRVHRVQELLESPRPLPGHIPRVH